METKESRSPETPGQGLANLKPLTTQVRWEKTADTLRPYKASPNGSEWVIQVNDFPDEHLYTLFVDGRETDSFDDWPTAWLRSDWVRHHAPSGVEDAGAEQVQELREAELKEWIAVTDPSDWTAALGTSAAATRAQRQRAKDRLLAAFNILHQSPPSSSSRTVLDRLRRAKGGQRKLILDEYCRQYRRGEDNTAKEGTR
jgi:hypothetical protein